MHLSLCVCCEMLLCSGCWIKGRNPQVKISWKLSAFSEFAFQICFVRALERSCMGNSLPLSKVLECRPSECSSKAVGTCLILIQVFRDVFICKIKYPSKYYKFREGRKFYLSSYWYVTNSTLQIVGAQ